jgi:uncharacterized protein (UPF0248 family)
MVLMVFETLNRLKWTGKLQDCQVVLLHRGAPGDKKVIPGDRITQVKKSYFYYKEGAGMGDEKFIPLHRVLEIIVDGEVVWKRKTAKG